MSTTEKLPALRGGEPQRVITVRMTEAQHAKLRELAYQARVSINVFCLRRIFGEKVPTHCGVEQSGSSEGS